MKRSLAAATGLLIALPVVVTMPAVAGEDRPEDPEPRIIAGNLNNPRQLNWAEDGTTLVVAEAGRGGLDCPPEVEPPPGAEPPESPPCLGPTGSISLVENLDWRVPTVTRPVEGLPSIASPDGSFAVGTNGADEISSEAGRIFAVAQSPGLAAAPTMEDSDQGAYLALDSDDQPAAGEDEGEIPDLITLPGGDLALLGADLWEAEQRLNPDGAQLESNPYAILFFSEDPSDDEDGYALVADAAANTVWKVAPSEADDAREYLDVSVFATYPTVQEAEGEQGPPEFVPTSLATDAHGHVFVGGLGSEVPGAASVVEYDAAGSEVRRWTGFTGVVGVGVDGDHLYVSQIFGSTPPAPPGDSPDDEAPPAPTTAPGSVVKVSRHTADAPRYEVDVPFPAGLATDDGGNVYVSAYSTSPASGVRDAFGPGSVDLEGGQIWELDFEGARVVEPVTPPTTPPTTPGGPIGMPGDGGPVGTDGKWVPVDESYYEPFTDEACGTDVTVAAGDVREVEVRVTTYPTGDVKTEYRGRGTVDVTRESDGAFIDELDISGEGFDIISAPDENGQVDVVVSLEGASISLPMNDVAADALTAAGLPEFLFWIGGNLTFEDRLQLGETEDSLPEIVESAIIHNTAVGVYDVCEMLDAALRATPTPTATETTA